ncbi:hypothetical protein [Vibrio sp. HN007]|uniref:hypothetical protein n=1 Tax=Vibrio iocasae TaxID=3098914 RepID=UPI0035D4E47C
MAKRTSRKKKDSKSKEPLIVAFVVISFGLIMYEVGLNVANELNAAEHMKVLMAQR